MDFKYLSETYETDRIFNFLSESINTTHRTVGLVAHCMFKSHIVCVAEEPKQQWYEYKDGLWAKCDGTGFFRNLMSVRLVNMFKAFIQLCEEQLEGKKIKWFVEYNEEQVNAKKDLANEIIVKLQSISYKKSVVEECQPLFKDEKFLDKLNTNAYLLSFGKNTYDLKDCKWRLSDPKDYISFACGLTKEEVEKSDVNHIENILKDIFIDDDRRNYFTNICTDLLVGRNVKETFSIWIGGGRNGKGLYSTYLAHAFGDYFIDVDASVVTSKTKSQTANPELIKTRGRRIIMISEPENGTKLNNALIKRLTGGDKISARALYENSVEFKTTGQPIIQCNNFELENINDDSIPDRLIFNKFNTHFVNDPKHKFQRKIDKTLKNDEKVELFAKSLMKLLLERWGELNQEFKGVIHDFKIPECVEKDKFEFLDDNNDVKMFTKENIKIIEDENCFIKLKDIPNIIKKWTREKGEEYTPMKRSLLKSRLDKYLPEFMNRHRPYINGEQKEFRSVYINCKWSEDIAEYLQEIEDKKNMFRN